MSTRIITFQQVVLIVLLLGALTANATSSRAPYGTWLKPIKLPELDGPATLEFGVIVTLSFDTMVVKSKIIGDIEIIGPETWVIRNDGSNQYVINLDVNIPPTDTSGILLEFYVRKGRVNSSSLHFVTTGDTLEISKYWPKPKIEQKWPVFLNAEGDTLDADSLIKAEKARLSGDHTKPKPVYVNSNNEIPPGYPFGTRLSPVELPALDGPATLEFRINARKVFDSLTVKVITIGNIGYEGPKSWVIRYDGTDPIKQVVNITIPRYDTCGLRFELYKGKVSPNASSLHFVTTGDTLEISKYWPKPKIEQKWPVFLNAEGDTLDTDSPIKAEKARLSGDIQPPQTVKYRMAKGPFPDTEQERKEELEMEPLTKYHRQFIMVDSVMWVRDKGEYEFRRAQTVNIDSLEEIIYEQSKTDTVDIVLDLAMPDNYEAIKRLVKFLLPMERTGFYRTSVTREKAAQIQDMGIRISLHPNYPDMQKGKRQRESKTGIPARGKKPEDTNPDKGPDDFQDLFLYDFEEDNLSGTWYATDSNTNNGYDYWGIIHDSIGRVRDGDYSAWCAFRGDSPAAVSYDDNMNAWMYLKSPINIQGYSELELSFAAWWKTEANYDRFIAAYSFDRGYWYYVLDESGDCNEDLLYDYSDNIYTGDYVYIGFIFVSDNVFHEYEGAYVDNVELWGYLPEPNLTYGAPVGWSDIIVVSSVTGTNTSDDLYANEPAYVDLCAINYGDWGGVAGPYTIGLYVDNVWIHDFHVSDSSYYNDMAIFEDYPITLSDGFHTPKIVIDRYNQVDESEELDNEYEVWREWDIPTIMIFGQAQYRNLGDGGLITDARNVWVELLDYNHSHAHTFLDADWTEVDGSFMFGPIPNIDHIEGGRLDIYARIYARNIAATVYHDYDTIISRVSFTSATIENVPSPEYNYYEIIAPPDTNGDDEINIGDAVHVINYVFKGGDPPVQPCCP